MNIWNCFHGCKKYSEGCKNCYMYYLDSAHTKGTVDSSNVYLVKTQINYPLATDKYGKYKVKSESEVRVGLNTDFFLTVEEAGIEIEEWRKTVWDIIRMRPDVKFSFLTKRAFNIENCLPDDWGDGWENVSIGVTMENQERATERFPYLKKLKAKHKYIFCAPLLTDINLEPYISEDFLDYVYVGGENYGPDPRPCDYKWVKHISDQCKKNNISCTFIETGTRYINENGTLIEMPSKTVESKEAAKSGLSFIGKEIKWNLNSIDETNRHKSWYAPWCETCGEKPMCQGCDLCGKCGRKIKDYE